MGHNSVITDCTSNIIFYTSNVTNIPKISFHGEVAQPK